MDLERRWLGGGGVGGGKGKARRGVAMTLLGWAGFLGAVTGADGLGVLGHLMPAAVAEAHGDRVAGATLFHERGCEHCHGVDGRGGELGPDLSTVGKRRTREYMERQIREGGGGMPAFGDALQADEVTNLLAYLQAKRTAPK